MAYLFNAIYVLLLLAAVPWLLWCRLTQGKYRDGWSQKLWGRVPLRRSRQRCLWLHAVSVGEVNLLAPLIARWEQAHPEWEIVISTTTHAGFALAQKRYAPRMVFYAPLDFTWSVARSMRRIRPSLLVLAELELWPNWIAAAHRAGARVAVVNGRLSARSFRGYHWISRWLRGTLSSLDLVAAQTAEYAQRFISLGVREHSIHVTGSIKFDGAETRRDNPATRKLTALAGIQPTDQVFIAGSTQAPEEALALETFQRLSPQHPNLRLLITPRHPERFDEVARLLDKSGLRWQRRSRLEQEGPDPLACVLLIDVVGELGAWWGTSQIAFVGGSLGRRGGQNMIEPAAYGAAVSFGPNTWNFKDVAQSLLESNSAVVVKNAEELQAFVARCLHDRGYALELGRRAQRLVSEQQGAADRTVALLENLAGPETLSLAAAKRPPRPLRPSKRQAG
jgi:3-deoxy-D-manno-octulosonic-acid transferase